MKMCHEILLSSVIHINYNPAITLMDDRKSSQKNKG